jgi:hypothetical protein
LAGVLFTTSACGALSLAVPKKEVEKALDSITLPPEPELAPGFENFYTTPAWQVGKLTVWLDPTRTVPSGNINGAVHVECLGVRSARSQSDGSFMEWEFPYHERIPIIAENNGGDLFTPGPSTLFTGGTWAQSISSEVRTAIDQWMDQVNQQFAAKYPGAVATGRIIQAHQIVFFGKQP